MTISQFTEVKYVVEQGNDYWPRNKKLILDLPICCRFYSNRFDSSPKVREVRLPDWASDIGIYGNLLIPTGSILPGSGPEWKRTNWFYAAFWYISGIAEWYFEKFLGRPVHSYSFKLSGWDNRLWERAWVNRIFLFLRRWAAYLQGAREEELPRC